MTTLLTLNIWNLNEPYQSRWADLVCGIRGLGCDVVCLQEVSIDVNSSVTQSELIAQECSYNHHLYSTSGWWRGREEGLAILSKLPIKGNNIIRLPSFAGDMPRQAMLARVALGAKDILVLNTHLAFPISMVMERRKQALSSLTSLIEYKEKESIDSVIFCGDLNDVPHSAAVQEVIRSPIGLYDTYYDGNPRCDGFTFSSRNKFADPALGTDRRIDYIFATRDTFFGSSRLAFDGRDEPVVSDHFGLEFNFELR